MSKPETKNNIKITAILIIPLLLAILAVSFYENKSEKEREILAQKVETGQVAGIQHKLEGIEKELPIMPNAEISSVDTSNNKISVTLEAPQSNEEIVIFYDDFFFVNGWKEIKPNQYVKNRKTITLTITENVIRLDLVKK